MLSRWEDWSGALGISLIVAVLVALDLTDHPLRRWWADHAFTAAVVSGVLVLAVTVLLADRVVNSRRLRDRSQAIAAQAAILLTQAERASRAVSSMLEGGDRDAAGDELRTYMTMLLISAPVLIDARLSREFLEQAQGLGGKLAYALGITPGRRKRPPVSPDELAQATAQLHTIAAPLLDILNLQQLVAAGSEEAASASASEGTPTSEATPNP